jgi:hypothetical protein
VGDGQSYNNLDDMYSGLNDRIEAVDNSTVAHTGASKSKDKSKVSPPLLPLQAAPAAAAAAACGVSRVVLVAQGAGAAVGWRRLLPWHLAMLPGLRHACSITRASTSGAGD